MELDGPKLQRWLDGEQDLALTQHAYGIVEKHFTPAGLRVSRASYQELSPAWKSSAWYISRFLMEPIASGQHDDVVRAVFSDLVDLVSAAPDNTSDSLMRRLWPLLWELAERGVLPPRVVALLPPKATAVLPALAERFLKAQEEVEEYEADLIRQGQMGY